MLCTGFLNCYLAFPFLGGWFSELCFLCPLFSSVLLGSTCLGWSKAASLVAFSLLCASPWGSQPDPQHLPTLGAHVHFEGSMSDARLSSCDITACVTWDGLVSVGPTNRFETYHSRVIAGSLSDPPSLLFFCLC